MDLPPDQGSEATRPSTNYHLSSSYLDPETNTSQHNSALSSASPLLDQLDSEVNQRRAPFQQHIYPVAPVQNGDIANIGQVDAVFDERGLARVQSLPLNRQGQYQSLQESQQFPLSEQNEMLLQQRSQAGEGNNQTSVQAVDNTERHESEISYVNVGFGSSQKRGWTTEEENGRDNKLSYESSQAETDLLNFGFSLTGGVNTQQQQFEGHFGGIYKGCQEVDEQEEHVYGRKNEPMEIQSDSRGVFIDNGNSKKEGYGQRYQQNDDEDLLKDNQQVVNVESSLADSYLLDFGSIGEQFSESINNQKVNQQQYLKAMHVIHEEPDSYQKKVGFQQNYAQKQIIFEKEQVNKEVIQENIQSGNYININGQNHQIQQVPQIFNYIQTYYNGDNVKQVIHPNQEHSEIPHQNISSSFDHQDNYQSILNNRNESLQQTTDAIGQCHQQIKSNNYELHEIEGQSRLQQNSQDIAVQDNHRIIQVRQLENQGIVKEQQIGQQQQQIHNNINPNDLSSKNEYQTFHTQLQNHKDSANSYPKINQTIQNANNEDQSNQDAQNIQQIVNLTTNQNQDINKSLHLINEQNKNEGIYHQNDYSYHNNVPEKEQIILLQKQYAQELPNQQANQQFHCQQQAIIKQQILSYQDSGLSVLQNILIGVPQQGSDQEDTSNQMNFIPMQIESISNIRVVNQQNYQTSFENNLSHPASNSKGINQQRQQERQLPQYYSQAANIDDKRYEEHGNQKQIIQSNIDSANYYQQIGQGQQLKENSQRKHNASKQNSQHSIINNLQQVVYEDIIKKQSSQKSGTHSGYKITIIKVSDDAVQYSVAKDNNIYGNAKKQQNSQRASIQKSERACLGGYYDAKEEVASNIQSSSSQTPISNKRELVSSVIQGAVQQSTQTNDIILKPQEENRQNLKDYAEQALQQDVSLPSLIEEMRNISLYIEEDGKVQFEMFERIIKRHICLVTLQPLDSIGQEILSNGQYANLFVQLTVLQQSDPEQRLKLKKLLAININRRVKSEKKVYEKLVEKLWQRRSDNMQIVNVFSYSEGRQRTQDIPNKQLCQSRANQSIEANASEFKGNASIMKTDISKINPDASPYWIEQKTEMPIKRQKLSQRDDYQQPGSLSQVQTKKIEGLNDQPSRPTRKKPNAEKTKRLPKPKVNFEQKLKKQKKKLDNGTQDHSQQKTNQRYGTAKSYVAITNKNGQEELMAVRVSLRLYEKQKQRQQLLQKQRQEAQRLRPTAVPVSTQKARESLRKSHGLGERARFAITSSQSRRIALDNNISTSKKSPQVGRRSTSKITPTRSVRKTNDYLQGNDELNVAYVKSHFRQLHINYSVLRNTFFQPLCEQDRRISELLDELDRVDRQHKRLNQDLQATQEGVPFFQTQTQQDNEEHTMTSRRMVQQQRIQGQIKRKMAQRQKISKALLEFAIVIQKVIEPNVNGHGFFALLKVTRTSSVFLNARYFSTPICNLKFFSKKLIDEDVQTMKGLVEQSERDNIGILGATEQILRLIDAEGKRRRNEGTEIV